jgi:hypothetical protein
MEDGQGRIDGDEPSAARYPGARLVHGSPTNLPRRIRPWFFSFPLSVELWFISPVYVRTDRDQCARTD